jgi:hypothetical protein
MVERRIKATYSAFANPPDLGEWNLNSLDLAQAIEAASIKLSPRAANEALSTMLENDAYVYFSETKDDPLSMSLTIDDAAQFEFVWQFSLTEIAEALKERMSDGDDLSSTIKALREMVDELERLAKEAKEKSDG